MILSLDHLVVLVEDLEAAVAGYEEAGFRVTPGGEHADGLTRNALVPFADGTYLERVEFLNPSDHRDNVWGWRALLGKGESLVDYCALSDDLAADARRLREEGLAADRPDEGGRRLPDGEELRWRSVRVRQEGRLLPFMIEDATPRELRVPGGAATEHPNGATGIRQLFIAARDAANARSSLAALAGGGDASAGSIRLGRHELTLATPDGSRDAAERLEALGPGPFALELRAAGEGSEPDPRLTAGVRMWLG